MAHPERAMVIPSAAEAIPARKDPSENEERCMMLWMISYEWGPGTVLRDWRRPFNTSYLR